MFAGGNRETPPPGRHGGIRDRLGIPLAAAVALGGQMLLSSGRGLYLSLEPGAALLVLALALLSYVLIRRGDVATAGPEAAAGGESRSF